MNLPNRALTNIDLKKYAKILKIPYFRGVYMRNNLPKEIRSLEAGIVNLDDKNGPGTHWTAYVKKNKNVNYFDSYGNLKPPLELVRYFKSYDSSIIQYNYQTLQTYNSNQCGHLCLKFLYNTYN